MYHLKAGMSDLHSYLPNETVQGVFEEYVIKIHACYK